VNAGGDWEAIFSSPEDAILRKMEFYREGGSDKHLRDIAGVLKANAVGIDTAYIERWAATLGVTDVWRTILARLDRQNGGDPSPTSGLYGMAVSVRPFSCSTGVKITPLGASAGPWSTKLSSTSKSTVTMVSSPASASMGAPS
jgi:hypothetical protein